MTMAQLGLLVDVDSASSRPQRGDVADILAMADG